MEPTKLEFLRIGSAFANIPNTAMAVSVASEVSSGPALQEVTAEDVDIISILAQRKEPWVLGTIFSALGRLSKPGRFSERAQSLILTVDIGSEPALAEAYCRIVGPGPFSTNPAHLRLEIICGMLNKLIPVYELDGHFFGAFISHISGRAPLEIAAFFEARLEYAEGLIDDGQSPIYKPIPSSFQWSTLSEARQTPEYGATLRRYWDTTKKYPDSAVYLSPIFWRVGSTDATTFGLLLTKASIPWM